ncbi:hypothetical protein [Pseudomonas eucalypticola]|uniref:Uncharacterized protein n=1 Tax=Pseudomonas eucalypticola TaxID=2599595 RepID=A0A7D5D907_9PSED|nr:hypothetical protein [Pseudomonas eucalypticola]QKZ05858.1 hypothetical protein HWQ56_19515 [Pseudomonas eucalypticola]
MPKIIDVIITPQNQTFLLLDQMPSLVYVRNGSLLTANDGGFYDFMKIVPGSKDAFAGRAFTIRLADGSDFECTGQVWSCGGSPGVQTLQVGVGTIESLSRCYVFSSATVDVALINEWLAENKPSRRYYKYDKRETVEYWDALWRREKWGDKVSPARARTLRKRGVTIFRHDGSSPSWSPSFERKKAQIAASMALDA